MTEHEQYTVRLYPPDEDGENDVELIEALESRIGDANSFIKHLMRKGLQNAPKKPKPEHVFDTGVLRKIVKSAVESALDGLELSGKKKQEADEGLDDFLKNMEGL